jgi:hypothetical protein
MNIKIRGNQSPLVRSLQAGDYSLKLVVVDMPHNHSIYGTTRKLAKAISVGEEGVPARPFMKQFFSENRSFIMECVNTHIKLNKDIKVALEKAGWEINTRFAEWVMGGGVKPENTVHTIRKKGHDIVLVGSLTHPDHLIYAVQPVVQLRDKRKR